MKRVTGIGVSFQIKKSQIGGLVWKTLRFKTDQYGSTFGGKTKKEMTVAHNGRLL
jgi:hypothetical protein